MEVLKVYVLSPAYFSTLTTFWNCLCVLLCPERVNTRCSPEMAAATEDFRLAISEIWTQCLNLKLDHTHFSMFDARHCFRIVSLGIRMEAGD